MSFLRTSQCIYHKETFQIGSPIVCDLILLIKTLSSVWLYSKNVSSSCKHQIPEWSHSFLLSLFAAHKPAPVKAEKLVSSTEKVIGFTVESASLLLWPLSNRAVFAKGELLNIHFTSMITKLVGIKLSEGISCERVQHLSLCVCATNADLLRSGVTVGA